MNVTINYGSILCMKIKDVNPDMNDFTLSIPILVLTGLNADFDGDILNIVLLTSKKLKKEFNRVFNPKYNMFVSRTDGMYNNDYGLLKDQIIGLREFCNI